MDIKVLLMMSVKEGASDLHLSPTLPPMVRINGDLSAIPFMPVLGKSAIEEMLSGVMTSQQKNKLDANFELDFNLIVSGLANFRVHAFHQNHGIAAVFRVIPYKTPGIDELGLPPSLKQLLDLPNGLILVTGPTGSGKSTTLAAMVDDMNGRQASHIITIEDPIEFTHLSKKCLVSQRQVHRDTIDYTSALRSSLREDPDVIVLSEMRDLETIRLALTAAETGHLVMATLHASGAPRAIHRIVDVFPVGEKNIIRNMLSESLQAVICQTLVKKHAGGRIAALEMMLATPAIRNLIREDKIAQLYNAIQTGGEVGMHTLDQHLQGLVSAKIIDKTVAFEAAVSKDSFR